MYNAPRPLYGELNWKGPFLHGVFYAAMNPVGEYAQMYREFNETMDAWPVEWVTEPEARRWLTEHTRIPSWKIHDSDSHGIWVAYIRDRGAEASNKQE